MMPDQIQITHQPRTMSTLTIRAALDTFQQAANRGTAVYLSPELVQELRAALKAEPEGEGQEPSVADVDELCAEFGFHYADLDSLEMLRDMIAAALARWAHASAAAPEPRENPATPPAPAPETPAEALAVRPLLEQVAAMANNIGAHTVGEIAAISSRAEAWLRDNPPGARSCVESASPARVPGDVATVAQWLQDHAPECRELGRNDWAEQSIRAAVLIQRMAFPAYLVVGRPPEGFSDLLAKSEPGEVQICSTGVSIEPLGDAPGPTFQDAIRLAELDDQRREAVHQAVAEALGSGAYDCTRVWSAWQVGTMGEDDFCLLAENPDRVAEIADAAIEAIRAIPAPQAGEVAVPEPVAERLAGDVATDDEISENIVLLAGGIEEIADFLFEMEKYDWYARLNRASKHLQRLNRAAQSAQVSAPQAGEVEA
jgi:hypothetical protein